MKAQIESSCVVGEKAASYLVGGVRGGKVQKKGRKSEDDVNTSGTDMNVYLNKLQEIVPFMPKNKRLSKVEVISYVIDYIHDLRETLGMPPCSAIDSPCDLGMEDDNCHQAGNCTTVTSTPLLCSSKVCDNTSTKTQDQECRTYSGEE